MVADIDYPELRTVIDRVPIRNGTQFEYRDMMFSLFTYRRNRLDERDGTPPFFWKEDSSLGDYVIYLALNVGRREFRKPILMHETLEAFLFEECKREEGDWKKGVQMAHKIAAEHDERYAREILTGEMFNEYVAFKASLHNFLGGSP